MYNFAERYIFLPLFTLLFALAILGLIYPDRAIALKRTRPALYGFILFSSALMQFPLLMRGYWEMGIAYSKINRSDIFDSSLVFLPFLYLALFILSIYCQLHAESKIQKTSFTLAVYTSFIIGPFAYLFLMGMLYYFLR